MTLDESIGKVTDAVFPHGYGLKDPQVLQTALRQFAEAIAANAAGKASEGRESGTTIGIIRTGSPPEPKECGPDKLPTAVQMKIEVLKMASVSRELKWSELEDLARLCFEIASRGRG